jgi:tripartite ATP-independent transporter DctM subunit
MFSAGVLTLFALCLVAGIPIAFCLYFASYSMLLALDIPPMILVQRVIGGIEKYPLLCIPFFILAGSLMGAGGITQRLIHFANLLVGRFRGALGLVDVLACMIYAGISGSAVADATSIGSIMIPSMKKEGYNARFAAAITASAAICGPIIPPSIPMVVLGIVAGLPIGKLFLAGAIPGIIYGLLLMIAAYINAVKNNYPKHEPASLGEVIKGIKHGGSALAMPLVIIGGIATGAVTDAELGVLAALYALMVGVIIHRELTPAKILDCLKEAVISTAVVLFVMGAANLFSWLLAISGLPKIVIHSILALTQDKAVILILINAMLLVLGCFIDPIPAILLLSPILMPLTPMLGMDPIQFGVMFVFNMMLGMITPPVGLNLMVVLRFAGVTLVEASRAALPYLVIGFVVLILIIVFPWITLFLPSLVF